MRCDALCAPHLRVDANQCAAMWCDAPHTPPGRGRALRCDAMRCEHRVHTKGGGVDAMRFDATYYATPRGMGQFDAMRCGMICDAMQ